MIYIWRLAWVKDKISPNNKTSEILMKHDLKNQDKNNFTLIQEWKVIKQTFSTKWSHQEMNLTN